jgi:hypothetical protein
LKANFEARKNELKIGSRVKAGALSRYGSPCTAPPRFRSISLDSPATSRFLPAAFEQVDHDTSVGEKEPERLKHEGVGGKKGEEETRRLRHRVPEQHKQR